MPISMHPSARYVTQQGIYNNQLGKPLSNRKIAEYQRLGFYGPASPFVKAAHVAKVVKKKKLSMEQLFGKFDL